MAGSWTGAGKLTAGLTCPGLIGLGLLPAGPGAFIVKECSKYSFINALTPPNPAKIITLSYRSKFVLRNI